MSEPAAGSEREEIRILSRMRVDPDFHRVQRQVTRDNMGYAIHRQELKKERQNSGCSIRWIRRADAAKFPDHADHGRSAGGERSGRCFAR